MIPIRDQISWLQDKLNEGSPDEKYLASILQTVQHYAKDNPEIENKVYAGCLNIYKEFLQAYGLPCLMDGRQGKALKEIIAKIRHANTNDKTDMGVMASWALILKHWNRTGDYIGKQKKLSDINKHFLEIIDKIRNGHDKKSSAKTDLEQYKLELAKRRQNRGN